SPEMAVLEWLFSVPNEQLFSDGVVDTFGGLTNLRPRRLQVLLQACTSIRTKRAFLLLARFFKHGWYSRLDIPAIDLGQGKRQLVKGGVLDKEYQVTVPMRFANADWQSLQRTSATVDADPARSPVEVEEHNENVTCKACRSYRATTVCIE